MNSQRPISRKKIQTLVILTILAWATQTLLHQWGYGAEPPASGDVTTEKFVPEPSRIPRGATIALRSEATIHGGEVRLKQICRWSDGDAKAFAQMGELVVARFTPRTPFKTISVDEIRQTLHDAGVNLALIQFAGPLACTVNRSDVEFNEHEALDDWIAARQPKVGESASPTPTSGNTVHDAADRPATQPASAVAEAGDPDSSPHTLRELLSADLAVRLGLPKDDLQINFNPADQKLLNLSEPQFKFNLNGRNVHNLGAIAWEVQIVTDSGSKRATIQANARAWQKQVTLTRPLAYKQIVQAGDLQDRRMLTDRLPDEPLLSNMQIVGQQAARDLKPGTIVTSRMMDPVPLVRTGQFVTVQLQQGNVRIKTVARAMEGGSFGQTIKVKNEATRDIYEVVITGPQEAAIGATSPNVASIKE